MSCSDLLSKLSVLVTMQQECFLPTLLTLSSHGHWECSRSQARPRVLLCVSRQATCTWQGACPFPARHMVVAEPKEVSPAQMGWENGSQSLLCKAAHEANRVEGIRWYYEAGRREGGLSPPLPLSPLLPSLQPSMTAKPLKPP